MTIASILADVGPFLETVRPWISPVALTAILGVVLTHRLGLRKVQVDAERVEVQAREVHDKDEADIRDHYADEVRQLRESLHAQSSRHQEALDKVETKLGECRDREDGLRDHVRELKDEVAGLIRIITQASASAAIHLTPAASAEVAAAARRVQLLFPPVPEEDLA